MYPNQVFVSVISTDTKMLINNASVLGQVYTVAWVDNISVIVILKRLVIIECAGYIFWHLILRRL